jgi:hypothetical protein
MRVASHNPVRKEIHMNIGQKFYMSSKTTPSPRLFQYIGQDAKWFDPYCNHMVKEVSTGEISHVELELWLNQRKIRLERKNENV